MSVTWYETNPTWDPGGWEVCDEGRVLSKIAREPNGKHGWYVDPDRDGSFYAEGSSTSLEEAKNMCEQLLKIAGYA